MMETENESAYMKNGTDSHRERRRQDTCKCRVVWRRKEKEYEKGF